MTPLTFPGVAHALAAASPDDEVLVQGERRCTWSGLIGRVDQFASTLHTAGLGPIAERGGLAGWECGQDTVALVLRNAPEFIEAMVGAMTARTAPFNVNFRYTTQEMTALFVDARPGAIVFHSEFSDPVVQAAAGLARPPLLMQVDDGTGRPHDAPVPRRVGGTGDVARGRRADQVAVYEGFRRGHPGRCRTAVPFLRRRVTGDERAAPRNVIENDGIRCEHQRGTGMTTRTAKGCALLVTIGMALAACGDDDDGAATSGSEPVTSAASSAPQTSASATSAGGAPTTSARPSTTAGTAGEATGEPVAIMMINAQTTQPQFPERLAAAKAAAAGINADGGVGGRPLEILSCDTKNDGAQETACGQELVASDAVALVDAVTQKSTSVADLMVAEGIANIGPSGVGPSDLLQDNTSSFPIAVSAISLLACPAALAAAGGTSIGALTYSGGSAQQLVAGVQAVTANVSGASFTGLTQVDFGVTDMAGPLQTAIDNGATGLVLGLGEAEAVAVVKANGGRLKLCTSDGIIGIPNLTQLGEAADGWIGMSSIPSSDLVGESGEMGAQYVAELDAYYEESGDEAASPEKRKTTGLQAWIAVHAFEAVADELDTIDRASVLEAFSTTTDLEFPGLIADPVDFTQFQVVPNLARLFVPEYNAYTWSVTEQANAVSLEGVNVIQLLTGS